jgi:hypothetical protein
LYKSITNYEIETGAEGVTATFDDRKLALKALKDELNKAGFEFDGI